jgi:hypothetical protein
MAASIERAIEQSDFFMACLSTHSQQTRVPTAGDQTAWIAGRKITQRYLPIPARLSLRGS